MDTDRITRKFVLTTPKHSFGPLTEAEFEHLFQKINSIQSKEYDLDYLDQE